MACPAKRDLLGILLMLGLEEKTLKFVFAK